MQIMVTMIGQEELLKKLNKLANPAPLLDESIRQASINLYRDLVKNTIGKGNLVSGNTSRAWTNPFKSAEMAYQTENAYKTQDGNWNVARLIDTGRRALVPKNTKFLYVPLTKKGQMKRPGAKTTGLKWGTDFVLKSSVKKVSPTNYLDECRERASKDLTQRVTLKIRETLK